MGGGDRGIPRLVQAHYVSSEIVNKGLCLKQIKTANTTPMTDSTHTPWQVFLLPHLCTLTPTHPCTPE